MVVTFVTQSRIASLTASLSVAVPEVTERTSAPSARIRSTFGAWRRMSSSPMNTTHGRLEQGAGRRGRHAVLAGARLGDDPRLAQAPREQRLAQRVVDLVGAGVGEVLALEVQPQELGTATVRPADGSRAGARLLQHGDGQPVRAVQRRGSPDEVRQQVVELRPERGVVADARRRPAPAATSAAMSVSGTKRPPKSRSMPQRPCAVRLQEPGVRRASGRTGAFGHGRRACHERA